MMEIEMIRIGGSRSPLCMVYRVRPFRHEYLGDVIFKGGRQLPFKRGVSVRVWKRGRWVRLS